MNQSSTLLLKLGNYRMRTQIMLLLTILVLIIAALTSIIIFINLLILEQYFTQSSNLIFIKESINQIQRNSAFYLSQLNRVFEINENELKLLASIYVNAKSQVEKMTDFTIQDNINYNLSGTAGIPIQLQDPKKWGNYAVSYSVQCYSNTTVLPDPLTPIYKQGVKIQEYFISIGQIIHQSKTTNQGQYYGYFEADQIMSNFPCVSLGKDVFNYKPTKRSWYQKAKELYKASDHTEYVTAFTEPYLQYTIKQIGIALVLPVVDEKKQFLGAWGTNIVFSKILDIFKIENQKVETMFLINQDGILLMHSFGQDLKQFPIYFQNESLTGFNQDDWDQIKNKEKQSNCNSSIQYKSIIASSFTYDQHSHSQIVCRYNSKFNKDFIIGITQIEKYNMKLVMMIGSEEVQSFNEEFIQYLKKSVNQIIEQYFISLLIVLSILFLLITIIIYYVFQPIENIIKICYNHILQNNKKFKVNSNPNDLLDIAKIILSKQIRNLYISFMAMFDKLNQLSLTKSQYCRFLEQLKFPCKSRNKHERNILNKIKLFRHNNFTQRFTNAGSITSSIMIYLQQSNKSQT